MELTRYARYRGAMLGGLAGDALGAPYEMQQASVIRSDFAARGGLASFEYIEPFKKVRRMPPGHPTDDSELTARLAQSIIECDALDASHAYQALRRFIVDRQTMLATGKAYGSGRTLRAALHPLTIVESIRAFDAGEVPIVPSNGSLMRCIPIPLAFPSNELVAHAAAYTQSQITHRHELAVAACVAYTAVAIRISNGMCPEAAWAEAQLAVRSSGFVSSAGKAMVLGVEPTEPDERDIWSNAGSAVTSLQIALWAVITAADFRDGLTKAISVGGDTDTYGAIAGGLLGLRFGEHGVPSEWRDILIGKETMLSLADSLLAFSERDRV